MSTTEVARTLEVKKTRTPKVMVAHTLKVEVVHILRIKAIRTPGIKITAHIIEEIGEPVIKVGDTPTRKDRLTMISMKLPILVDVGRTLPIGERRATTLVLGKEQRALH